jgi:hypothetical protein
VIMTHSLPNGLSALLPRLTLSVSWSVRECLALNFMSQASVVYRTFYLAISVLLNLNDFGSTCATRASACVRVGA